MRMFAWFLALAPALLGCTENNEVSISPTKDKSLLELFGSAATVTEVRTSHILPESTLAGVYVLSTGDTQATLLTSGYQNLQYISDASGILSGSQEIWLVNSETHKVVAYSPYSPSEKIRSGKITLPHTLDMLYAPASAVTINPLTAKASAELAFSHILSQISFTLASGDGKVDLTDATLKISGLTDSCTLDLSNGSLSLGTVKKSVTLDDETPVCLVPGVSTLELELTTATGEKHTGSLTRTFEPNTSYHYTLTVNNLKPLTMQVQLVDWQNVSSGDAIIH
jgi:hypothetical protein